MQQWTPETPFGVVTPYWLQVGGRWRLQSAVFGLLAEYVTCPVCEQQRDLIFETATDRLELLADITCPAGHRFTTPEITGYDLKERIDYLNGDLDQVDDQRAEAWATDPDAWTGPVDDPADAADDEVDFFDNDYDD